MSQYLRNRLTRRYLFTGELVLQTAMHLGGGDTTSGATDSPVVRRADGQPFIPGSSLKGAFRSTVEKLAATLELPHTDIDVLDTGSDWIKKFNQRRQNNGWSDERTVQEVLKEWPATALLFGTPYTASNIFFMDAYLYDGQETIIQRRDGVAIDRDSERAMDRLKYDYEVVPPTLRFSFELRLENPDDTDLGLTCLGISELLGGFFSIGGKRSSGLGRCQLEGLQIYALDLDINNIAERAKALQKYLVGKNNQEKFSIVENPEQFVSQHIDEFLKGVGLCSSDS